MKNIGLTLVMMVISILGFSQNEEGLQKVEDQFRAFVTAVENDDREAVAEMINYPLKRPNPIPTILNEEEFISNYDNIFDENFIEILGSIVDDPEINMIDRSGATGKCGFVNGKIWIKYGVSERPIHSLNPGSEAQALLAAELTESINILLPKESREYERNVYMGKSVDDNYIIRLDELSDGYRYSCWNVGTSCQKKPDFVLSGGELIPQGSGGSVWYKFNYETDVLYIKRIRIAQSIEQLGDFIVIEQGGSDTSWKLEEISNQLEFIKAN